MLLPPTSFQIHGHPIEVSLHYLSDAVKRELMPMFPSTDLSQMIALATCQRALEDLVSIGPAVEQEKDRLLESFMLFATEVCDDLVSHGHWADCIDPCSGLAMRTKETSKYYDEVSGMQSLLQYRVQNAGCCKILLHPVWGSAVYPATIFTTAPLEAVLRLLSKYNPAQSD